ncbi:MAG: amidohydrolase family protein [Candidatus Latescibacterota bacterium]|nr:amidohydrolase family protein [Candidatus Latescibacterota bacterium]
MAQFDYIDFDREIWDAELEDFVPSTVYDMHVHMWSEAHAPEGGDPTSGLRFESDYADLSRRAEQLYPGREVHYLVLGTPVPGLDVSGHNDWLASQMAADPASAVNMLVTPDMSADHVADQVNKHNFLGLKPYRTFASDPAEARIRDFLPEHLIELAHDMGLAITMHLSKRIGPADPENQEDLERYTRQYPRAQWILAHCARAFNAFMMEGAIEFLCGLPNIWYDTSAVNDMYTHFLLMEHEDRRRVMFGSDNIVAGCARGKYVTYGHAWEYFAGHGDLPHCNPTPTLVIYEQLRQERQVADMLDLTPDEIEDHFSRNAQRFLSMMRECRSS